MRRNVLQIPYWQGNEKRRKKGKTTRKKRKKEGESSLRVTLAISDCLISLKEGLASGFSNKQRSNTSQKWGGQRGP